MTDEEMAEEIANKRCHDIMCYGHCSFNSPKHHRCGEWHREYNCALAGLKAGRPQWHDLEKDPTDLPKEVGNYIVCFLDTVCDCERHTFELSFDNRFEDKHWIDEDNHNIEGYDEGVIAWCEIPKFDKE